MGVMNRLSVDKMLSRSSGKNGFVVVNSFFDRQSVINATDTATRNVLSKFGAFVRRTMKSSIRKRKRTSRPGEPPSSHAGQLKDFIYFAYEPATDNVVIGPEKLNAKIGNAPEALEYGGTSRIATYRRAKGKKTVTMRNVAIKARPFAHPALAKELPKLPEMWRNSVKSKV